jgi:RNA polymerase sigma-70 factor (ECF subfamily)
VYDALASRLLAVALHLTRDSAAAEDLVQATFVTAIERAATWKREMRVEPWLVGILGNHARNHGRSSARVADPRRRTEQVGERGGESPLDAAHARELDEALEKALVELPEVFRPVLVLRLRHGLTSAEIAAALGRPPGTVRTQLARGLEFVRRALPVGLAGAFIALAARPARGLDVIRQVVLGHARAAVPAAGAASVVTGVVLMKKLVALVVVLALVATGWILWPETKAEPALLSQPGSTGAAVQDSALESRGLAPAAPEVAAREGLAQGSAPSSTRASARKAGRISITARLAPDGKPAPAQVLVLGRRGPGGFPLDEVEFLTDEAGRVVLDEQAPGACSCAARRAGRCTGSSRAGPSSSSRSRSPAAWTSRASSRTRRAGRSAARACGSRTSRCSTSATWPPRRTTRARSGCARSDRSAGSRPRPRASRCPTCTRYAAMPATSRG